jgi:hypothetical protein
MEKAKQCCCNLGPQAIKSLWSAPSNCHCIEYHNEVLRNVTNINLNFCLLPSLFLYNADTHASQHSVTQFPSLPIKSRIHKYIFQSLSLPKLIKETENFLYIQLLLTRIFMGLLWHTTPLQAWTASPTLWATAMNDLLNFVIIQHYYAKRKFTEDKDCKNRHIDRYGLHLPFRVQSQKGRHSTLCCEIWTIIYLKWFSWTQQ